MAFFFFFNFSALVKDWTKQQLKTDQAASVYLRLNLKTVRSTLLLHSSWEMSQPHIKKKAACKAIQTMGMSTWPSTAHKSGFLTASKVFQSAKTCQTLPQGHRGHRHTTNIRFCGFFCHFILLVAIIIPLLNSEIPAYFSNVGKHSNKFQWFKVISFVSDSCYWKPNVQASVKPK